MSADYHFIRLCQRISALMVKSELVKFQTSPIPVRPQRKDFSIAHNFSGETHPCYFYNYFPVITTKTAFFVEIPFTWSARTQELFKSYL